MMWAIQVKDLCFRRGQARLLQSVSFSVEKGAFFVVIGPNGSGKTTLMRLVAGLEKGFTGGISVMDRPIGGYGRKDLAKTIAFVPQSLPVDLPFTVAQIVLMGRSPHLGLLGLDGAGDQDRVRQALDFTGLAHLAHRRLSQLSGGECQRVFIAQALCQEPDILLLDEPTAALDPAHQIRVMDLMESLRKEKGVTVVMVSHDLNLAAMYADRLLLLKAGQTVCTGDPSRVLDASVLETTYGCRLVVDASPVGPFPRISMVSEKHAGR